MHKGDDQLSALNHASHCKPSKVGGTPAVFLKSPVTEGRLKGPKTSYTWPSNFGQ